MRNWDRDLECDVLVMLHGTQIKKKDVPLGKEFAQDGRIFQTSLGSGIKLDLVPLNGTFKFGDEWCAKMSPSTSYALVPNGPFGRSTSAPSSLTIGDYSNRSHIDDPGHFSPGSNVLIQ